MGRHNARVFKNEGTRRTQEKSKGKTRKVFNEIHEEHTDKLKKREPKITRR